MTTAASSSTTVYFVSGANRGIGFGIVEKLAARPNSLVYAAAREPAKADKLQQLAKQRGNVRVVQLSVDSDADHAAAAKQVEAEAGRVDVLLANAGIAPTDAWQRTEILSIDKLRDHFEVNTVGPIRLFQAFFPLLGRSSQPRFVVVSTIRGSIQMQANYATAPGTTYGLSKAAVNFFTIRVHVEHPTIITFPVQPGWVQTEMGNAAATAVGKKEAPVTLEQSVAGLLKLVDESTRATHSGKFWNAVDGTEVPW